MGRKLKIKSRKSLSYGAGNSAIVDPATANNCAWCFTPRASVMERCPQCERFTPTTRRKQKEISQVYIETASTPFI